jgi:EF-P beta-lysylation protein EpmB
MATILAGEGDPVEATFAAEATGTPLPVTWQQAMKRAVRSGRQLCELLQLPPAELVSLAAEQDFPVFAPRELIARMRVGDPGDPILRQVLGVPEELSAAPATIDVSQPSTADEVASRRAAHAPMLDPVGDLQAQRGPGLLQKYDGRALLITSGACAVHCRYCFRRHFPYDAAQPGKVGWARSLDILRADDSLDEVILSGGDPLTVTDDSLRWLIAELNAIPHIRRIRIHTRVPVVIPQRICASLLEWVESSRAAIYFVLHFNHPNEIDPQVEQSIKLLRQSGCTLLNQAVLLRHVNDSAAVQRELCQALVNMQVLPYYLHQLDLVQGAMHFEVDDLTAQSIIDELRATLPGYAVPKLVREIAGERSKTPV